ncbi:glycosyltransferase [Plantactinospora sp. KLBMP9567]|uniref:glycosyltransferase n=1 Tax=Plantactinospora sp. KLBMP9567 TaxID=3085900 RepID=UPI0029819922|nr:glycosyltransferase [Plantactinospora sp. KLBMP9567]MDW5322621.1 glycosyltransferase [Plantactinospora sp. KLBMP9567]
MRPLRVLRIISRMAVGEAAPQVGALMRGLDPDRFEQRLYAGPVEPGTGDYRRLRASDVPVRVLPALRSPARPVDNVRALAALITEIRHFQPDLVHTHDVRAGVLGRVAAVTCRVPIRVHTFHTHPVPGSSRTAGQVTAGAEWMLARTSHALVAVGARLRDELLAASIGRADQYTVMPPGASLSPLPGQDHARRTLGLPETGPVVAYIGPLSTAKRPDRFLTVARAVRRTRADVRFVVCGEGAESAETVRAAAADRIEVTFLPWRSDLETVYAAADLVIQTSDHEGTPLTLIEAGHAGRPVVATDVGGTAEVIRHGRSGLLCDRRDIDGLSRAVLRLLADDELRHRMGRTALAETREAFGTPRLVAATRDLYHRLAMARGCWPTEPAESPGALARAR